MKYSEWELGSGEEINFNCFLLYKENMVLEIKENLNPIRRLS